MPHIKKDRMDLGLSIALAVMAFLPSIVLYFFDNKNKNNEAKRKKSISLIIIAVCILGVTCWKSIREYNASAAAAQAGDSLNKTFTRLSKANDTISMKLTQIDTLAHYIKRVEQYGIKRDTITNRPIITSKYYNQIDKVGTLNQY